MVELSKVAPRRPVALHLSDSPEGSAWIRTKTAEKDINNVVDDNEALAKRLHSLKPVNDTVNDTNALSVNHTQLNFTKSKSHSRIRAECILHLAICICVID